MTNPETEATWLSRIKSTRIGLTVTAVAGLLIAAAATTDATDKLLIWTHIEPDALQLAENNARGQFSRDLTQSAWRRLFWMRRLVLAAEAKFTDQEKNEIWASYLKSLEEWNSNLMINILSLQRYYGSARRQLFERKIQHDFGEIHYCLEALRHPAGTMSCKLSTDRDPKAIEGAIDRLNSVLYCFVSGLPDETGRSCSLK